MDVNKKKYFCINCSFDQLNMHKSGNKQADEFGQKERANASKISLKSKSDSISRNKGASKPKTAPEIGNVDADSETKKEESLNQTLEFHTDMSLKLEVNNFFNNNVGNSNCDEEFKEERGENQMDSMEEKYPKWDESTKVHLKSFKEKTSDGSQVK